MALAAVAVVSAIAQTTFEGTLYLQSDWRHKKTAGASTLTESFRMFEEWTHTTGTNANQMATIATVSGSLTNSQAVTVNLKSMTNGFGDAVAFANVRFLAMSTGTNNTDAVTFGNTTTNGFVSWTADVAGSVSVSPGGIAMFTAPDQQGYAVGVNGSLTLTNTGTNDAAYVLYVGGSE